MTEQEKEYLEELIEAHYQKHHECMGKYERFKQQGEFKLAAETLRTAAFELEIIGMFNKWR